jgi:hypothetical protein
VHLRAQLLPDGSLDVTWIRRTRVDGDSWESVEVPLGEEREAYRLEVRAAGLRLRSVEIAAARYVYGIADRTADQLSGPLEIRVCQVSDRFGAGPEARLAL